MKASHCNPQCILNSRLFMALVLIMIWSATENAAQTDLRGQVGGNVTFHCSTENGRTIEFFYLQKGRKFVNGYHASRTIKHTWPNTRLGHDKTTVHMYRLNVSHSGDYNCHICYNDSEVVSDVVIHLSLTANYSKPAVKVYCREDGSSCLATCVSHGGYPSAKIVWKVPSSEIWTTVNSSEKSDPDTMMVNSSSTAIFNCSRGELQFLSCSVDGVTSDTFSVCGKTTIGTFNSVETICVILALVLVPVLVLVLVLVRVLCKKRLRCSRSSRYEATVQRTENGHEAEIKFLTEGQGGEKS